MSENILQPKEDSDEVDDEFCFVQGEFLFHDMRELRDFSDEPDSVPLYDD